MVREFGDRRPRVHPVLATRERLDRRTFAAVLVLDLADDGGGEVLQRHQACSPAVLVHHHGERLAQATELAQQRLGAHGLGNVERRPQDGAQFFRRARLLAQVEHIAHVEDAGHVIDVRLDHRVAAVPGLPGHGAALIGRLIEAEVDDVLPRDHQIAGQALGKAERPVHQVQALARPLRRGAHAGDNQPQLLLAVHRLRPGRRL